MALFSNPENNVVTALANEVALPKMVRATQRFNEERLPVEGIPQLVQGELSRGGIKDKIRPGMVVAVSCGSRGLANMQAITRAMADFVKAQGASPFIFPAMGSHGGATAAGQLEVLASFGVTEETMGCPVRATMDTVEIGRTAAGMPVYMDRFAHEADGVMLCNRIKAHTAYNGPYESGLLKMAVIGMGKQHGAETVHEPGFAHMARLLPEVGRVVLAKANVIAGLALIENAFDETALIRALTPAEILSEEPALLQKAKSLMGRLHLNDLDVLVVERMGKDISGDGMDPNVTGHFVFPELVDTKVRIGRVAVLDLTDATHGNCNGLGMADVTTKRLVDKIDVDVTYPNVVTSTALLTPKVPLFAHSDKACIQIALRSCNGVDRARPRIVRIRDTMHLSDIWISEALMEEAARHPHMEVHGAPEDWGFDALGNLF